MSKKKEKQKKEKIIYIDDGRTLADMSGVQDRMRWAKTGTSSRFSDIWKTYWNAVRMMFLPMLVTIGFLLVVFLIAYIVLILAK